MKLFRKKFLKKDTISVPPNRGYLSANNQSKKAVEWLLWMENVLRKDIKYAGRCREHRIDEVYVVDGYYEDGGERHILQFHDCFWHGCLRCYTLNRDKKPHRGRCHALKYENTRAQAERLRSKGYIVTEIWECEFDKIKKKILRECVNS